MIRTPILLLPLVSLAVFGCRQPEHPNGTPIDETGEDDCPGCFDVAGMLWNLQTGLEDGSFATVHTGSGDRVPSMTFMLVEEEYYEADTTDQASYSCSYQYTPAVATGSSNPSALFDWELTLVPVTDGCGDLDPDWIAPTLYQDLAEYSWEMVAGSLDDTLKEWLQDWFVKSEADWESEGEPYYFGLTTLLDGDDLGADGQGHYGRAYAVDEDMNIASEGSGGSLLTTEQVASGVNGFYEIYAYSFITPYADLP